MFFFSMNTIVLTQERRGGGHLRPDRVSGRLVARPSRVGRPTSRPQPLVTIRPTSSRPLVTRVPSTPARIQLASRAPAAVEDNARISSAEAKQQLERKPKSGEGRSPSSEGRSPLTPQLVQRPRLSAAKTQLVPRPTQTLKAVGESKALKPLRSRPQVPTKPRKTSRVISPTPRLVERPRPSSSPRPRDPKQLPISAMRTMRKPTTTTTPAPPPPTYIPASKPQHARDSYKEKYHTSESRVLYSLFREDITKQMKLPSKDGEDGEERENEEES